MVSRNDLIELAAPVRRVLRILWIDPARTVAYAFDVQGRSSDAELLRLPGLEADIEAGRAHRLEQDPFLVLVNQELLPPKHIQLRDRAWAIIRELVAAEPDIYEPRKRGQIIADYTARHGISHPTLYRYLRRYWQRGQTPNALLPDYANSGARGKTRSASEGVKRGRPRKDGTSPGVNVDSAMRRVFRVASAAYASAQPRMSRRAAYEAMLQDFFSPRSLDPETQQILRAPPGEAVPTFGQYNYWLEQDGFQRLPDPPPPLAPHAEVLRPGMPGAMWQLDAVRPAIQLVEHEDRSRLAGAPVLYIVTDTFSGMVVGMHASVEAPSWQQGLMALANCAADKARFCRRYGRSLRPGDWPVRHLPEMLRVAPALAEGAHTGALLNNFGVHCLGGAAQAASWRDDIGQRFKLHDSLAPPAQSALEELDGALDLQQFTGIVIDCIIEHNLRCQGSARLAPLQLWEWGLRQRGAALRQYPEEMVRCCLLPVAEALVTADGICLHGRYYGCSRAIEERWFERARQRGSWPVRVAWDPSCPQELYLLEAGASAQFHPCQLLPARASLPRRAPAPASFERAFSA